MNSTIIPHFKNYDYSDWEDYDIVKLNPTGKWKECRNTEGEMTMYIQHKGLFFTKWIHEDDIIFCVPEKEQVFACKRA